jgi:hypothetical protein
MGKLKDLSLRVQEIINNQAQDSWDTARSTIEDAKIDTTDSIIEQLEGLANEYGLDFEDLEELFKEEPLRDMIDETIDYVWDV